MKAINFPLTIVLLVFAVLYGCDNPPSIKLGSGCQLMEPVKSWWAKSYAWSGAYYPAVMYKTCSNHVGVTQPFINYDGSKYHFDDTDSNIECLGSKAVLYRNQTWVYEEADTVLIECKLK
jgi:hypothetical protein